MVSNYTHLKLNRDIEAIAGYYTPKKEVRLKLNGREVLYVINETVVDSSCCGNNDFNSALVPGYLVRWQGEINQDGLPVSDVESISDRPTRRKISRIIRENENVSQVEFW